MVCVSEGSSLSIFTVKVAAVYWEESPTAFAVSNIRSPSSASADTVNSTVSSRIAVSLPESHPSTPSRVVYAPPTTYLNTAPEPPMRTVAVKVTSPFVQYVPS